LRGLTDFLDVPFAVAQCNGDEIQWLQTWCDIGQSNLIMRTTVLQM